MDMGSAGDELAVVSFINLPIEDTQKVNPLDADSLANAGGNLRLQVKIDDELMKRAMQASGAKTKKAAIEDALQVLVRLGVQDECLSLHSKVHFHDVPMPEK